MEARDKGAGHTPGPWQVMDDPESDAACLSWSVYTATGKGVEAELAGRICEPANAALISRAPALLAEVARLREALERIICRTDAYDAPGDSKQVILDRIYQIAQDGIVRAALAEGQAAP